MAETKTIDLGPTGHTVRRNIERLRKAQGLSYAELSRKLGELGRPIPALGLRRIEAAQRRVDSDDLVALAIALQATPNTLLFPPVRGHDVWGEVTGVAGPTRTTWIWRWAAGGAPLAGLDNPPASYPFPGYGSTLQPVSVLTPRERHMRRKLWRDALVSDYENELREADEGTYIEDPNTGLRTDSPEYRAHAEAEIAYLKSLDPTDDDVWAEIPADPAREWTPPADLMVGLRFDG